MLNSPYKACSLFCLLCVYEQWLTLLLNEGQFSRSQCNRAKHYVHGWVWYAVQV